MLTTKIENAADFLDIKMLDHLVISSESYFSFADEGLLQPFFD
jgi:DNA repair protein RadC